MRTAPKKPIRKRRHDEGSTAARRPAEHGFTLVELMVVIVILGLLATIVAINVIPQGERAKSEKAKADIATIESGLELYKLNMSIYPTTSEGLAALVSAPAGLQDPSRYQKGGFIKKLPNDPWGRPYLYASPGTHGAADIWTLGADGKDGGEGADADIGSWQ
ncbi:type II secretion system major pseudopilin GspG [Sphingomonas sp. So64.6b]|uniref:type II secretion system major pseudopilin GspG n=1 Tax=Sphingomonas sp. So64.6b TaxID=2997354 RepID=UPI0016043E9F|nr:type II secretion system major pseudopilin GspG [Sphingomonas sp. So64.6b]QNA84112.1 type II secretion system major pseudopilin GspG [Sphingomonas sp. So64.6b]